MRETPLAFAKYFLEHFCSARLRNLSRWWQKYSDLHFADLVLITAKLIRKYNPLEAQFPEKVGIKVVSKHTAYHRPSDFYSGHCYSFWEFKLSFTVTKKGRIGPEGIPSQETLDYMTTTCTTVRLQFSTGHSPLV